MRSKREEGRTSQFENTSLTDIVMNIFIFFFIASCMLYTFNPKVSVTLPVIPRDEEVRMPIEITIDRDNDIYLRNDKLSAEQLTERLREESPYQPIVVRGDKNIQYGRVDEVLETIWRTDPKRTVNLAIIVEE